MPLGMEVGLGLGDIVLDGTKPAPAQKNNVGYSSPTLFPPVYYGQTVAQLSNC